MLNSSAYTASSPAGDQAQRFYRTHSGSIAAAAESKSLIRAVRRPGTSRSREGLWCGAAGPARLSGGPGGAASRLNLFCFRERLGVAVVDEDGDADDPVLGCRLHHRHAA